MPTQRPPHEQAEEAEAVRARALELLRAGAWTELQRVCARQHRWNVGFVGPSTHLRWGPGAAEWAREFLDPRHWQAWDPGAIATFDLDHAQKWVPVEGRVARAPGELEALLTHPLAVVRAHAVRRHGTPSDWDERPDAPALAADPTLRARPRLSALAPGRLRALLAGEADPRVLRALAAHAPREVVDVGALLDAVRDSGLRALDWSLHEGLSYAVPTPGAPWIRWPGRPNAGAYAQYVVMALWERRDLTAGEVERLLRLASHRERPLELCLDHFQHTLSRGTARRLAADPDTSYHLLADLVQRGIRRGTLSSEALRAALSSLVRQTQLHLRPETLDPRARPTPAQAAEQELIATQARGDHAADLAWLWEDLLPVLQEHGLLRGLGAAETAVLLRTLPRELRVRVLAALGAPPGRAAPVEAMGAAGTVARAGLRSG